MEEAVNPTDEARGEKREREADLTFTLRSAAVSVVAKQKRLRSGRMQRCAPPASHAQVSYSRAAVISFPSPARPEAPRPCDRGARACSDGTDEPVPWGPRPGDLLGAPWPSGALSMHSWSPRSRKAARWVPT
jgi:hypothetical protein